jgi:Flp pilus assembly pilin Flp
MRRVHGTHRPFSPTPPLLRMGTSPQGEIQLTEEPIVKELLLNMWSNDEGQDIAEYAVMLAVILVIVVGTIKLIGSQANNVFSETASAMS